MLCAGDMRCRPAGSSLGATPAFETAMLSDPQQAATSRRGFGRRPRQRERRVVDRIPEARRCGTPIRAPLRHRIPAKSSHKLRVRSSVDVIPARRPVRHSVRSVNGSALVSAAVLAPITASEDAYVQSDVPATNFGTATTLNNVSGTPEARAYLKFNVSGVSGTITKATFRVFTQTSSGSGYELHAVGDNTWTEAGLNYANRPAVGALIGTAVNFTANTWTSVDVTSVVKANGTFSFEMNARVDELEEVREQGVGRERAAARARDVGPGQPAGRRGGDRRGRADSDGRDGLHDEAGGQSDRCLGSARRAERP